METNMDQSYRKTHSPQKKMVLLVLFLLLLGAVLTLLDRDRIAAILSKADWRVLPGAIFFIACANALLGYAYAILARLMGIRMERLKLAEICFVSTMVNRVIRSAGAAGFSLRYLMMKPYGIGLNDVLNSSIIHFLLSSMVFLGLIPLGILYTVVFLTLPEGLTSSLVILAAAGAIMSVTAGCVVFSSRLRENAARLAAWLGRKIVRRDISGRVAEYARVAARAALVLKKSPSGFAAVILLVLAEVATNVFSLGYCLRAFGPGLNFGGAGVIYGIGTLASVFSVLPGGMVLQEGAMTGLSVAQGISFEQSVLAAMLFRVVQTVLPYFASFVFYPHLLKAAGTKGERPEGGTAAARKI